MRRLRYENDSLDGIDRRIVRLLVDHARISVANIARRVGLSGPSVSERLRRLEESGTIAGYTVKVNPAALGLPLAAWLRIRPVPGQLAAVIEIVKAIPQVASCDRVTGEDCLIASRQALRGFPLSETQSGRGDERQDRASVHDFPRRGGAAAQCLADHPAAAGRCRDD